MTTIKNTASSAQQAAAQRAREEAARRAQEAAARRAQEEAARQAAAQRMQAPARPQAPATRATPAALTSGFTPRGAPTPLQLAPAAPQLSAQGAGFSPAALQRLVASGQAPQLSKPQPYDVAGATSNLSGYRYAPEGDGTTVTEAVAEHVVRGGVATGEDGALNCTQAAYESQEYFANQNPPVETEIVAAGDHAVLRMPNGSYWDPSRAMTGQDGFLTPAQAQPYEGVDGVTVAERRDLEAAAAANLQALGSGATVDEQLQAARTGAEQRAKALGQDGQAGEVSATTQANDVSGSADPQALATGSYADWLRLPPVLPDPGMSGSLLVESPGQRYEVSVGTSSVTESENGDMVTVSLQVTAAAQASGEFDAGVVEGGGAVFAGGRVSVEVTMGREQYEAWRSGELTTPINPMDPSTMPPGTGVMIRAEAVEGSEFDAALTRRYAGVFGSTSHVESEGIAVGISNVSNPDDPSSNVVRVVVGPTQGVSNEMQLGVKLEGGGITASASLGRTDTSQSYDLVVADFDMNTAEGRAAYDHFLRSGELPQESGSGVRLGTLQQTDDTSTASIGVEVEIEQGEGSVTAGGALDWGTNAATTRTITWEDGTVERQMGGNTGSATIELTEVDPPGDAPPTRTFKLGNTALEGMTATAMAMAFNGGQPVNFDGQVNFEWTLTEADAMDLRDDARAYAAWHQEEFGFPPDKNSLQGRLAAAETPGEVFFVLAIHRGSPDYVGAQLDLMYHMEGSPLRGETPPGVSSIQVDDQPE